ncbi:guanine nucleotide-binding protein G(s) subunit alpha-like isoform X2 [Lineus longissimus]|uniref:guanine nucleotide-binding protein G(s) subunit alpha-like isoform X2 n=1 Tax=Lineus longissimus TaxID=88925 RepID=UPI002B4F8D97
MSDKMSSCLGPMGFTMGCSPSSRPTPEEQEARARSRQINKSLRQDHEHDMRKIKLLLLGIGESGKSTVVKQMKIIHIDGFDDKERRDKIQYIKKNLQESIVTIVNAMATLGIGYRDSISQDSAEYIMTQATSRDYDFPDEFFYHAKILWEDDGIKACYDRSHEYQLIDCAAYFLNRIDAIREDDYMPTDQDILRCRVMTTSINKIDFMIKDRRKNVHFSAYDVGGQRGERRRWIQVFECVTAILFIVDSSSFDQTLREDESKNRLLESLEIFEQTWKNRFLRTVSCILFINKIDKLKEKVDGGRTVQQMISQVPANDTPGSLYKIIKKLDYPTFQPKDAERKKFLGSYPGYQAGKKLSKSHSIGDATRLSLDHGLISQDVIKNAVFIQRMFTSIAQQKPTDEEEAHTCHYYYTCAVNTDNVQKVLNGTKSIVITEHLRRFGIL